MLAEAFLNATGSALVIFKAKKWSWEIKMTPSILAAYLQRTGVPNDAILTGHDLQLMHHSCIYEILTYLPETIIFAKVLSICSHF